MPDRYGTPIAMLPLALLEHHEKRGDPMIVGFLMFLVFVLFLMSLVGPSRAGTK